MSSSPAGAVSSSGGNRPLMYGTRVKITFQSVMKRKATPAPDSSVRAVGALYLNKKVTVKGRKLLYTRHDLSLLAESQ